MIRPFAEDVRISQQWGANPTYYARFGQPYHNGTDYAAPMYTPLLCIADGQVAFVGTDPSGYGLYTRIWHEELLFFSFYAHMSDLSLLKIGKPFKEGEKIGSVGNTGNSTGPHLHLEIRYGINRWKYAISPYDGMGRGRVNPETVFQFLERLKGVGDES